MHNPILLMIILFLTGCAGMAPQPSIPVSAPRQDHTVYSNDNAVVAKKLMEQYAEWKGTSYRIGGLSKSGVDCSGFVYLTFLSKLNVHLPRSTALQAKCGVPVSQNDLQVGDLVFFKTGFWGRHVGVYIGEAKFMHASSTRGVSISKLTHKYWASAYSFSRRIKI